MELKVLEIQRMNIKTGLEIPPKKGLKLKWKAPSEIKEVDNNLDVIWVTRHKCVI